MSYGPCIICGDTNYNLSMGGPTICPPCDCGDFGIRRAKRQAKIIELLRKEIGELKEKLNQQNTNEEGQNGIS